MPNYKTAKWNGYLIRLFQSENDWRYVMPLVPYFWDSEITFDLAVKIPQKEHNIDQIWKYYWELRDINNHLIKNGNDSIIISNIGFRRKLANWNSGKRLAINLGNLSPHKQYMLRVTFINQQNDRSDNLLLATFSIKDRDEFYMQIFLLLFSIVMALFFGFMARGCGING